MKKSHVLLLVPLTHMIQVVCGADYQIKQLTAPDGAPHDMFGHSVALNGTVVVVGVREADIGPNLGQGAAYLFERDMGGANQWGFARKLVASDGVRGDGFGSSVAVSSDVVVVGAINDDSRGAVYIFERNAGGIGHWGQVKKLAASDGATSDFFGGSAAVDQDVIIVGASGDDVGANANQGSAYVFVQNAGGPNNWGLVRKLTLSDGAKDDTYGSAVAVSGNVIAVGARYRDIGTNNDQGIVCLYERNTGGVNNWGLIKQLTASDGATRDRFGFSVSLNGDVLAVGAYWDDVDGNTDQGSAYVFERNAGGESNWGQVRQLLAYDGAALDLFGYSVSVSGDMIVVGAKDAAVGANPGQGAAYVFGRATGGVNNWGLVEKLTSSEGMASDAFGRSVCASGDLVVASAPGNDVGDNANQGSAYLFAVPANRPPIAGNDGVATTQDHSVSLSLDKMLANDQDPDGDPLTVISVSSSLNGAIVLLTGTNVIYTPIPSFTGLDRFTYTISDDQDGKASAEVEVMVVSGELPCLNRMCIEMLPAGVLLRFVGTPGYTYACQRSTNLVNWLIVSNAVAPLHGVLDYFDPDSTQPTAFFRTMRLY